MDLGIAGKRGIVCAASKGLGRGCAERLAEAGVSLVINARTEGELAATAGEISRAHNVDVTPVAADITTPEGRAKVLEACPDPDILVTNAGGPPPGMWSDWSRDDFVAALDANMLTPIALMQAVLPGLMARGWGRVVNITSQSVKSPIPVLGLSNARHGRCPGRGPVAQGRARATLCDHSRRPLRHGVGIRRGMRLPVFPARGLHRRPERPARRRGRECHPLNRRGAGFPSRISSSTLKRLTFFPKGWAGRWPVSIALPSAGGSWSGCPDWN